MKQESGAADVGTPKVVDVRLGSRRFIQFLIVATFALAVLSVAANIAFYGFDLHEGGRVRRMFQFDSEGNVPTWFNAMLCVVAAVLLGIIALGARQSQQRWVRHWIVLAGTFLLLSIVEITTLREDLIGRFDNDTSRTVEVLAWVVPAALLCLIFAFAYFRFVRHLPCQLRRRMVVAGVVYLGGAIGIEIGGSFHDETSLAYNLLTDLEETAEMLGLIVLTWALLEHLRGTVLRMSCDP